MPLGDMLPLLWLLVWLGVVIVAGLIYGHWAGRKAKQARRRHFERSKTFRWDHDGAK